MKEAELKEILESLAQIDNGMNRYEIFKDFFDHEWQRLNVLKDALGLNYSLKIRRYEEKRLDLDTIWIFERNDIIFKFARVTEYSIDFGSKYEEKHFFFDSTFNTDDISKGDIIGTFEKALKNHSSNHDKSFRTDISYYDSIKIFLGPKIAALYALNCLHNKALSQMESYNELKGIKNGQES